jgi:hypothetical protein
MDVDINSVVLATRVYAVLRERFLVVNGSGDKAEADGGEVLATIRSAITEYVDEQLRAA